MARIRTIKPEFPQSESIGNLSRDGRLLFILLWTIADDAGRTRAASRMLASLLYPYDADAPTFIDGWLQELEDGGHIRRYEIDGAHYLDIPNWLKHQKIDKPSKSKIPEYRESSAKPREESATDLGPRTMDQDLGYSEANASGAEAPTAEIVSMPVDARGQLFGFVPSLVTATGRPEQKVRQLLGKWLKAADDDAAKVSRIVSETLRDQRADPVSWIERSLKPSDPDAAIYRGVL